MLFKNTKDLMLHGTRSSNSKWRGRVAAPRNDRIHDKGTERDGKPRPHAHERSALSRPPIQNRANAIDAKEGRDESCDDDDETEGA